MSEKKEAPVLRFEEGMKQFMSVRKGLSYFKELAVDIFLGEEHIGHIRASGKVTISGHVTGENPCRIMHYSNTFTLAEQWMKIGEAAKDFIDKCIERKLKFDPAFTKLEDLARSAFSENKPFGHIEIANVGHDHLVIAGGKGEWDTYAPGIYTYDDSPYQGEPVKLGYRPVEEQRIKGVNNLDDEMLAELVKAARDINSIFQK